MHREFPAKKYDVLNRYVSVPSTSSVQTTEKLSRKQPWLSAPNEKESRKTTTFWIPFPISTMTSLCRANVFQEGQIYKGQTSREGQH